MRNGESCKTQKFRKTVNIGKIGSTNKSGYQIMPGNRKILENQTWEFTDITEYRNGKPGNRGFLDNFPPSVQIFHNKLKILYIL